MGGESVNQAAAEGAIAGSMGGTASMLPTSQNFLSDLPHLPGVTKMHPTPDQAYMFARPITSAGGR